MFFIPRSERVRFFTTNSKHAARVTLGVDHAQRNIASARQCIAVLLRSKCLFSVSRFIMFLAMRVILGLGAVAAPVPAECLRPDVVARNEAPSISRFIMFLAVRVMPGLGALPHPFQPNVYAQRWQETRHPCVKGTGVLLPLGSATCMSPGCNHDVGVHDCYCSQGW